jgi:hypothetical protein
LAKKEAAAAPTPAYQLLHHREHVYESIQTTWTYLTYLQYLMFSDYHVVSIKNTLLFSQSTYSWMSRPTFLGGGEGGRKKYARNHDNSWRTFSELGRGTNQRTHENLSSQLQN